MMVASFLFLSLVICKALCWVRLVLNVILFGSVHFPIELWQGVNDLIYVKLLEWCIVKTCHASVIYKQYYSLTVSYNSIVQVTLDAGYEG